MGASQLMPSVLLGFLSPHLVSPHLCRASSSATSATPSTTLQTALLDSPFDPTAAPPSAPTPSLVTEPELIHIEPGLMLPPLAQHPSLDLEPLEPVPPLAPEPTYTDQSTSNSIPPLEMAPLNCAYSRQNSSPMVPLNTLKQGHLRLWHSDSFSLILHSLFGFSDADWAGCPNTRRSTTEAEYRAMASVTAEFTWLTYLLRDLGFSLPQPPVLFCDNTSALHMTVIPVFHARTKHIELDYHFVREKVAAGALTTCYVPSQSQLADLFTKAVSKDTFHKMRIKLGVLPPPSSSLRGTDKEII
uniref:Reverse transcriptase Ty1/copia-type domain-containing protein n=1 Tax=Fagus sylvatica TaxID=28930 RepID=A0A2N9GNK3_FAGSY